MASLKILRTVFSKSSVPNSDCSSVDVMFLTILPLEMNRILSTNFSKSDKICEENIFAASDDKRISGQRV